MRAALLEASNKPLEVVSDIDIEDPRAGEVLVRVSHCGLCHSDLSLTDGRFPVMAPTVLGHEAAGVVEAVGPDVTELAVGDKVVLSPIAACNACYWCVRGEYGCCVNNASIMSGTLMDGRTPLSRNGQPVLRGVGLAGFAELVITPVSGAIKVADDTPLEVVCVIGCAVQTGVGAVLNTAKVPEGATVLVLGAGGIGIAMVQGARIAGASRIIVSDPNAERRENAMGFGATDVIDPLTDDVRRACVRAHERHRRRRRVRRGRHHGRDRHVHQLDAQRRHDRARGRGRPRGDAHRGAAGADDDQRAQDHGLVPRRQQRPPRHPAAHRAVAGRAPRPRRHDHRPPSRSRRSTRRWTT